MVMINLSIYTCIITYILLMCHLTNAPFLTNFLQAFTMWLSLSFFPIFHLFITKCLHMFIPIIILKYVTYN